MKPKTLIMTALLSGLIAAGGVLLAADTIKDHDEVLRLRTSGRIMPMEEVMNRVQQIQPGQLVEVELEHDDEDGYVYEIETIDTSGRLHKLYLDASTGEVLKRKIKD